jgi:hypothetical protein
MATWKVELHIESIEAPAAITATTFAKGEDELVDVLNEAMDSVADVFDEDEDEDDEDYLSGAPYLEPDVRGTLLGQPVIVRVYPDLEAMEAAANGKPDPAEAERFNFCDSCTGHACGQ